MDADTEEALPNDIPERPRRFLRMKDLTDRLPVSRASIYRLMDADDFPKSLKIGKTPVWVESEIDDWIEAKVVDR